MSIELHKMAERLRNILNFNLAPGATAVIPHGLQIAPRKPLRPDIIFIPSGSLSATADAINVTITNNDTANQSGTVLVENWLHSASGVEVPGPLLIKGDQVSVAPGRVLWVAPSWPVGADPSIYFTTITAAITQAATMSPAFNNQVSIVIFPATYHENLTLVSNVNYVGLPSTFGTVFLNGNATWTPGYDVNLSQALANGVATTEQINWNSISQSPSSQNRFTFDSTNKPFTLDSNNKPVGGTQFFSAHSTFEKISFTGRGSQQGGTPPTVLQLDNSFFYAGTIFLGAGPVTFTDMQGVVNPHAGVEIEGVRFRGLNLKGNTICRIQSGENVVPANNPTSIALTETAQCFAQGVNFENPITVASGCNFVANGCVLNNTLTVAAGGKADIRATNFVSNANLLGAGTIDRSEWLGVAKKTSHGVPLVVSLTPNFPNNVYNVSLQLRSGPGNAGTTVTAKLGASFTITDAVGGNIFEYTLVRGG
jgi:hypothetical protein